MRKLVDGILDFKNSLTTENRRRFAELALGQKPDAFFIACSDSRVAANVFASTNPGDLFVVRNVGNMVPPCGQDGHSSSDESELAALEFALLTLKVRDIIICGHSECGAMQAITNGREKLSSKHLQSWLAHGEKALSLYKSGQSLDPSLAPHNQISQLNVLSQIDHLKGYSLVKERVEKNQLRLHAMWFDIGQAEVKYFDDQRRMFAPIDENLAKRILKD